MIRTEILIRAGRQHLSRSILSRRRSYYSTIGTTFSITLDGSSAIQPRDPSHYFPLISAATVKQRYHSRTWSHAPSFKLIRWWSGTYLCARYGTKSFLFSQALNYVEREREREREREKERKRIGEQIVGAPLDRSNPVSVETTNHTETKKERKRTRVTVTVQLSYSIYLQHVDAVRFDSLLNRSERSTWSALGLPFSSPDPHHSTGVQLTSPTLVHRRFVLPGGASPLLRATPR